MSTEEQSEPRPEQAPEPKPHPAVFRIGLLLMISSFALYPLYAVLLELPLPRATKVYIGFAAWGVSWASFALGSALAGKEGVQYLRQARWHRSD